MKYADLFERHPSLGGVAFLGGWPHMKLTYEKGQSAFSRLERWGSSDGNNKRFWTPEQLDRSLSQDLPHLTQIAAERLGDKPENIGFPGVFLADAEEGQLSYDPVEDTLLISVYRLDERSYDDLVDGFKEEIGHRAFIRGGNFYPDRNPRERFREYETCAAKGFEGHRHFKVVGPEELPRDELVVLAKEYGHSIEYFFHEVAVVKFQQLVFPTFIESLKRRIQTLYVGYAETNKEHMAIPGVGH